MTRLSEYRDEALQSKAWPFEEARKLVDRIAGSGKTEVLFETGYGPSGLPHIGTFGEVARTTMVRRAFETLSAVKTRLICFSDDMDGLRKVPDNIPNREMVATHLGRPLTRIPDPFGKYESFGHHNNAMLRRFLDGFGFDYEFASATDYYRSGRFDAALLRVLEVYDDIMAIMLPSLREERAATYSPFLPVHPETGIVMQVPIEERRPATATIVWIDPATGRRFETPVTGGHAKLQWKPDWGMRWYALGVDYEMSGKDLIDSVKLSAAITRALGGDPPAGFNYELFLDEKGQKISKSKGNGLTIDEWLRYASPESLQLFMYNRPREAKRLYFDVIPRTVDEYYQHLSAFGRQDRKQQLSNPIWHIHAGDPPRVDMPLSFSLLLNLVSACNASDRDVLWGFIRRHVPGTSPETHPELDRLVGYAVNFYDDFVRPAKKYRPPDAVEREALASLSAALGGLAQGATPEDIQSTLYDVGRAVPRYQDFAAKGATSERPGVSLAWFNALYQILLGEERGPRFGSFVALFGISETRQLIDAALAGKLA
ncbi:MAG TPA: lysine--tRNA ligase [Aestuariivirgaceae bacterium]|nr:lysine--tRNA ligase [Aestuariivirgaceae bacterium]